MIWVGDDWAEDHHDVEILGEDGQRLARVRLPEGLEGITRLHALIAEKMPASWADLDPAEATGRVRIGIETDRGVWVQALLAAGYQVYAINPMSVARYRERHSTSGAKSEPATRMYSRRSCDWTMLISATSPVTALWPRRSS
jgi:transposase